MILTNICKKNFLKANSFTSQLLPCEILNLVIFRWFNTKTKVGIDIQNWEDDGFDYAVFHPNENKVFSSPNHAGNRNKSFDDILSQSIVKANAIYNDCVSQAEA